MEAAFGAFDFQKFGFFEAENDHEILMFLVHVFYKLLPVESDFAKGTLVAVTVDSFGDFFLSCAEACRMRFWRRVFGGKEPETIFTFEKQSSFTR